MIRHLQWAAGASPALAALLALAAGCGPQVPATQPAGQMGQLEPLRRENAELRGELAARDRQIADLLALGPKRLDKLHLVQRIAFGSATGGVDLDKTPGDDAVKVTVEPIDQDGSVVKAAGEVTIQLYDLAAPPAGNLLAECRYDTDATARAWYSGFISYYYSFVCPWRSGPPKHNRITARVEFLDYLTGKRFEAQQVIRVNLPPRPAVTPPAASQPGAGRPSAIQPAGSPPAAAALGAATAGLAPAGR